MAVRTPILVVLGFVSGFAATAVIQDASADLNISSKKAKHGEMLVESEEGTPPAMACPGYKDALTPPPSAGKHMVTLKIKGKDGGADQRQVAVLGSDAQRIGEECGHTHDGVIRPDGPNTNCHRYIWQGNQWTLIHICP